MIKSLFKQFFGNHESAWDMAKQFGVELDPGALPVSDDLMMAVLKNYRTLSTESIFLILYFLKELNPTNTVKCSLKKLSKEMNCSLKDVKRAVSELECIGILHKVRHATGLYTFIIRN